jgi:hypothetical protein
MLENLYKSGRELKVIITFVWFESLKDVRVNLNLKKFEKSKFLFFASFIS